MDLNLYYFVTNDNKIIRHSAREYKGAMLIGRRPEFLLWVEKLLNNYAAMEFQLRESSIS